MDNEDMNKKCDIRDNPIEKTPVGKIDEEVAKGTNILCKGKS